MELSIIKDFVNNIKNNGEFSTKVVTATTPNWTTVNNPYVVTIKDGRKIISRTERVVKVTYYNNGAMIGGNYVAQIGTQIEKVVGVGKKEWNAEPMKGTEWEMFPYLMKGIKNNEQKYIRITLRHNAPLPKVVFILDGELVTDQKIIADIQSYIKPHSSSVKQDEFGIEEENKVKPLNIKIENVLYISQSGKEIGNKEYINAYFK